MLVRVSALAVGKSEGGNDTLLELLASLQRSPDGVLSLYRGLPQTLTTVGVSQAIYFFCYHWLRKAIERLRQAPVDNATNLLIAYVAGAINSTITCPLWAVSTQLKLRNKPSALSTDGPGSRQRDGRDSAADKPMGMVGMLLELHRREGVPGLFKGLPPALVLCVNPAIQFACYEFLKRQALSVLASRASVHSGRNLPSLVRPRGWPWRALCPDRPPHQSRAVAVMQ